MGEARWAPPQAHVTREPPAPQMGLPGSPCRPPWALESASSHLHPQTHPRKARLGPQRHFSCQVCSFRSGLSSTCGFKSVPASLECPCLRVTWKQSPAELCLPLRACSRASFSVLHRSPGGGRWGAVQGGCQGWPISNPEASMTAATWSLSPFNTYTLAQGQLHAGPYSDAGTC